MSTLSVLDIDPRTLQQQALASNPAHSAWVSANAGSGKTHVLTQRVVRLLLNDCDPSRILCLTFTTAAAGEMANRVFETLGQWAACAEDELRTHLEEVTGTVPTNSTISRARTLFARALETPGGLKIQTIHAFCEALLHQFPIEANVPGNFSVMDESLQQELMQQAHRSVFVSLTANVESENSSALETVLKLASDSKIESVLKEFVGRRDEVGNWLQSVGGPKAASTHMREHFQFADNDSVEGLCHHAVDGCLLPEPVLRELEIQCRQTGKTWDTGLATRIHDVYSADRPEDKYSALTRVFLTDKGDVRAYSKFCTKEIKNTFPGLEDDLSAEGARLIQQSKRINLLRLIDASKALYSVTDGLLVHYTQLKRERGLLDYDDLISCTAKLLRQPSRAWVMYKLDLGINHVLLDEAQDTSPQQWQIIRSLIEEFFSGESGRQQRRTVFAVGDEKQSIYSFQGARPELFAANKKWVSDKALDSGQGFASASLNLSFRSTQDVLQAVDAVFSDPDHAKGLTFDNDYTPHQARRRHSPGQVDIWPLMEAEKGELPDSWHLPVDPRSNRHQADILAEKVAAQISAWWKNAEFCAATNAPVRPGDIIVLVRARDRFASALTRYLKEAQVPVAGADRLKLTDHIAVLDLLALGSFVTTPADDLSLASMLKSPLIGLSEEELYELAVDRTGSLYEALRSKANDPTFQRPNERIHRWIGRADRMPIYEFYGLLLGADGGRRDFFGRLGAEVNDVLDAFLARTLDHERAGLPGLQAFVEALYADAPEIKREFDQQAGEVRIMTVHAAKGLEAPVVFLVDKCSAPFQPSKAPALYAWGDPELDPLQGGYLWLPKSDWHSDITLEARSQLKSAAEDEYRRLLYVAMTRAKDRLIVCGYKGSNNPPSPLWHGMVLDTLLPTAEQHMDESGNVVSYTWKWPDRGVGRQDRSTDAHSADQSIPSPLPGWIRHQMPMEPSLPRPLAPSGAQALIDESRLRDTSVPSLLNQGENSDQHLPRQRGVIVHRLLQILPDIVRDRRLTEAQAFLARNLPGLSVAERGELATSIADITTAPELSGLFDPTTSRAEVPVVGQIDLAGGPRAVSGTVDRLAILDDIVIVADFKTGRSVPASAELVSTDYLTQMALYRQMIRQIYADKEVRLYLIWTQAAAEQMIMHVPDALMDRAYEQIARL